MRRYKNYMKINKFNNNKLRNLISKNNNKY